MKIKDRILRYLEEYRGVYLSGEQLSKQLHITRQAVWKNIKSLVADGYDIHSVPNKGYMLDGKCDVLSATLIAEQTNTIVQCYDELSSTNEEAKRKFRQEGDCMIIADKQTNFTREADDNLANNNDIGNQADVGNGENISIALHKNFLYKDMPTYRAQCVQIVANLIAKTCGKEATVKEDDKIFINDTYVCKLDLECELNVATEMVTCVYISIAFFIRRVLTEASAPADQLLYRIDTRNNLVASIFNQIKSIAV
jgi:BirA family biotin operon repressor/biotin-[acetyl-CoA-carboxylase] ligase